MVLNSFLVLFWPKKLLWPPYKQCESLWTFFLIRAKFADFSKFKMSPNFQKHIFNWNWTLIVSIQKNYYIKTPYLFFKIPKKVQRVRYEQKMIILQLKMAKLVDCIIDKINNVFVLVTYQIFEKKCDEGFISSKWVLFEHIIDHSFFTFFLVRKM